MATELIPIGTTDAPSGDIIAIAGTPVTVFLKTAASATLLDSQARAVVEQKSSAGTYHLVGELNGLNRGIVIDGPGTFRVRKFAGPSFGVEQG